MNKLIWFCFFLCFGFTILFYRIDISFGEDIKTSSKAINDKKQHIEVAKKVLKDFLYNRSEGKYSQCVKYLTDNFINSFKQSRGTDFADYYRNQNEDYFRQPKITKVTQKDKTIFIEVVVKVEGPGYVTDANETYTMIIDKGKWKIDDWQIIYAEK